MFQNNFELFFRLVNRSMNQSRSMNFTHQTSRYNSRRRHNNSPYPKPPPPRHLPETKLQNNPPRRLRRDVEHLRHHPGRHQRFCHYQLNQLRQFLRRPASAQLSHKHRARQREPVMIFQTELGSLDEPVGDGEQPRLPITMPAPIDGNGFQAKIDGREMGAGGNAGLAQDRGGK
jgi:hypothetical protein